MTEPNYARIDGALLSACEETPATERRLTLFVHTGQPPTEEQARKLADLGVSMPGKPKRIFTATLSPDQVAALSHQDWIKFIKLSQRLKPLPDEEPPRA